MLNRFIKTYDKVKYFTLTPDLLPDALNIAGKWLFEHENDENLQSELSNIRETVDNLEKFGVKGGIFYADGEPVAMY